MKTPDEKNRKKKVLNVWDDELLIISVYKLDGEYRIGGDLYHYYTKEEYDTLPSFRQEAMDEEPLSNDYAKFEQKDDGQEYHELILAHWSGAKPFIDAHNLQKADLDNITKQKILAKADKAWEELADDDVQTYVSAHRL